MTEKRFKIFTGKHYGVQGVDGEVILDSIISFGEADVLVDWLNELYEENERLKQSFNEVLKDLEAITFDKELLEKKNEQLKRRNKILREDLTEALKELGDD